MKYRWLRAGHRRNPRELRKVSPCDCFLCEQWMRRPTEYLQTVSEQYALPQAVEKVIIFRVCDEEIQLSSHQTNKKIDLRLLDQA